MRSLGRNFLIFLTTAAILFAALHCSCAEALTALSSSTQAHTCCSATHGCDKAPTSENAPVPPACCQHCSPNITVMGVPAPDLQPYVAAAHVAIPLAFLVVTPLPVPAPYVAEDFTPFVGGTTLLRLHCASFYKSLPIDPTLSAELHLCPRRFLRGISAC